MHYAAFVMHVPRVDQVFVEIFKHHFLLPPFLAFLEKLVRDFVQCFSIGYSQKPEKHGTCVYHALHVTHGTRMYHVFPKSSAPGKNMEHWVFSFLSVNCRLT